MFRKLEYKDANLRRNRAVKIYKTTKGDLKVFFLLALNDLESHSNKVLDI